MSDGPARARRAASRLAPALAGALTLAFLLGAGSVRAEPSVRLLDLPFKVREMRGPRSEIATAVATSGLLPIVRAGDARKDSSPIAVVWGDEGGAILTVENGAVAVKPVGREAVEELAASETPKGALPGTRRALDGPLSVSLTGRTRGPDGASAAATLALRERQPMAVSTDPKPVPVATANLSAGDGAAFALQPPRIVTLAGRPAILAVALTGPAEGGLVLATRKTADPTSWVIAARASSGPRPGLAAVGDFSGAGAPQAATVDATGLLRLWTLTPDTITAGAEAAGYTLGEGGADLADALPAEGGTDLALPVAGVPALAVVSARSAPKGALRERLRVGLPAPAGTGVAVLGEGAGARLVVGLGDGRVAAIALDGGTP